MSANNFAKIFFVGLAVVLLESLAQAQTQITVLSIPRWSQATMGIGSGSYAPAWIEYGVQLPDFPVTLPMPLPYSSNPDSCNGIASAARSYVTGSISCGLGQSVASAGSTYRMDVYADVVPDSNVRVKFQANFNINWYGYAAEAENSAGFNFYATVGDNTGAQVNRITAPYLLTGPLSNSGQWAAAVRPPANSAYGTSEKTYYKLGWVDIVGSGSLHAATANALYYSAITGITANYIGKVLEKLPAGDNQIDYVGQTLPKGLTVRVVDGETNVPFANEPVTFTASGPAADWGLSTVNTITDLNGYATTYFTLGTKTGTYHVTATCPSCIEGVKTVVFTSTAEAVTELQCMDTNLHGEVNESLAPFRVRVFNRQTNQAAGGIDVSYSWVNFIDRDGLPGAMPAGTGIVPALAATDPYGIGRVYLALGAKEGSYVIRARCGNCSGNQECILRGVAHKYNITPDISDNRFADPDARNDDNCVPLTPILRITKAEPHNDKVSFTTHPNEDDVSLAARLRLPLDCVPVPGLVREVGPITWQVADMPGDYIDSSTPPQPAPGPASSFAVDIPQEPAGRANPLAYKITASAHIKISLFNQTIYEDTLYSQPVRVKQDEIDKCRQEYFDVSTAQNDLRVAPYFSKYTRDKFTAGVDGGYVKYSDCFAHIFPHAGKAEVDRLGGLGYQIKVTSGYRSPRRNKQAGSQAWNSAHLFGEAVDIQPTAIGGYNTLNGHLIRPLWLEAGCPKIIERRTIDSNGKVYYQPILDGRCGPDKGLPDWNNNYIEGVFTTSYVDEGRRNNNSTKTYDILEDLKRPANNIADIFDIGRVIHIGD